MSYYCKDCKQISNDPVCKDCGKQTTFVSEKEAFEILDNIIENDPLFKNIDETKTTQKQYIPKCPVCQSPNISKISTVNRAAHGFAFGLFSKTARSQWVCSNCGNKF